LCACVYGTYCWQRYLHSLTCPQVAAACSGVHCSESRALTSAPLSISSLSSASRSSMQHWRQQMSHAIVSSSSFITLSSQIKSTVVACVYSNLNLLRSCVEVREPIELLFGVVNGVGPGVDVRNGSPRGSRGIDGFWGCLPPWLNGLNGLIFKRNVFVKS